MNIDEKALKNMKDWMNQRDDIPVGWIYIGDDEERYILGQPGNRNLLIFGINPSTASPGDNNIDPTIRKVRKIAENDGFDGWIMVNIYPQRATDPKDLPKEANKELLAKNTDEVQEGIAQNMLKDGTIPIEKIAEFSNLSVERVKELAEKNIA